MRKKEAWITIGVFIVLLFGLTFWNLLTPDREFSYNENKQLEQMPEFSLEKLFSGEWQKKFEEYVTDQFVARDTWVSLNVEAERTMGKKNVNGVFFTEDGRMIAMHTPQEVDKELEEKNLRRLSAFTGYFGEKLGYEHTSVMLVPTAEAVLTELLPEGGADMIYDQARLMERARGCVDERAWIDVDGVLQEHKSEYIYYRTDHHWTMTGAFYAYRHWMRGKDYGDPKMTDYMQNVLSEDFLGTTYSKAPARGIQPDTMLAFDKNPEDSYRLHLDFSEEGKTGLYNREKLQEKDKYAAYVYGNTALTQIEGGSKNGRILMVVKDSYAHSFATLAAADFEQVYLVDPRYFLRDIYEFAEEKQITDVLFLFNTINFAQESKLYILDTE